MHGPHICTMASCGVDRHCLLSLGAHACQALCLASQKLCHAMQAAGIADRLKARNIGFAISDAALDVVVKVRRDFSPLLWPAKPE